MGSEVKDRIVDTNSLRNSAYRDRSNLDRRKAIYVHSLPYYNIEDEVINVQDISEGMVVLDVGAGTGNLLLKVRRLYPDARLFGIDISDGLVAEARERAVQEGMQVDFRVGTAQAIPFEDRLFDRVVMMHMLYHAPDINAALEETSRVLKQDGMVVVTANSRESRPVLRHLKSKAAQVLGTKVFTDPNERFSLENGLEMLRMHFGTVKRIDFASVLQLTSIDPYIEYFDSLRDFWDPAPTNEKWGEVMDMVQSYLNREISLNGKFTEATGFGMLVAKNPVVSNSI